MNTYFYTMQGIIYLSWVLKERMLESLSSSETFGWLELEQAVQQVHEGGSGGIGMPWHHILQIVGKRVMGGEADTTRSNTMVEEEKKEIATFNKSSFLTARMLSLETAPSGQFSLVRLKYFSAPLLQTTRGTKIRLSFFLLSWLKHSNGSPELKVTIRKK